MSVYLLALNGEWWLSYITHRLNLEEVFLKINEYNILKDNEKIKREIADKLALDEYKKYRVIQDKNYISDFDELITETKKLNNV